MSNELVKSGSTAVVATDVANDYQGLPVIQGQLLRWTKEKLLEVRQEYTELDNAYREAKERKWKASTLSSAAKKCLRRVEFYEKVQAALEAGYMLFPPIGNVDVVAIRTLCEGELYT